MYKNLHIVYVVPSRYDDDGYPVRWIKGVVPSNSLSVLKSLTQKIADNRTQRTGNEAAALPSGGNSSPRSLPPITMVSYDDNVEKIPFAKIARQNRQGETKVIVGIVGVQSNQFPRAADIAMTFRKLGIDVLIGGFHVTGVLALFDKPSPELQDLIDNGVTLAAGESETPGVLEQVFGDALDDNLQPVYRFPKAPDLTNAPVPHADPRYIDHFGAHWATIDSSRGCPFGCTFCTVINIQGRKMRCRSSSAVLEAVRNNYRNGVDNFFFTDDNFARSAHWEAIFDGLAEMRSEGKNVNFMMQIDTQAAKIPNFVDKAKQAGCRTVFIGMESVNPDNIAAAGKTQNHVEQYREMVVRWQSTGMIVHVGYIIGFPNDTLESVQRDVVFLRDNVGVDLVSFFMMTPLPGSVNHKEMLEHNEYIDPDLNKYDSFHETFRHPKMKPGEWKAATQLAYSEFYTKEHCAAILRRMPEEHYWFMFWNLIWYRYSGVLSGTHPMMTGFFRRKVRLDRRKGFPRENLFQFAWRWLKDFVLDSQSYIRLFFEFQEIWWLTRKQLAAKSAVKYQAALEQTPAEPKTNVAGMLTSRLKYLVPLAQFKQHWEPLKERVAEYNWQGQYEAAVQELANALTAVKARLFSFNTGGAAGKDVETITGEIDTCLTELEQEPASPALVYRTEQFIHDKVLIHYEAAASRCVKLRREVNMWRRNALNHLKDGRIVRSGAGLLRRPWLAFVEAYLSARFCIAVFRKKE
ncbi:MAG: radical SAM protein [Planctomycetaceae bacterium]|jgi:radical SAM superfamily enzyme YgiQ (UPF0313 family)|nr:radical SAM protein [Planctomycetaceae bacterium]